VENSQQDPIESPKKAPKMHDKQRYLWRSFSGSSKYIVVYISSIFCFNIVKLIFFLFILLLKIGI